MCCLLVLDSVTSTPQCIRQPRPRVYLKEPPAPPPQPPTPRTLRNRPPRRHNPPRHAPRQQQLDGGKKDVRLSANGPSTERCSKDVTTHQHRPGARPGCPCPVSACISHTQREKTQLPIAEQIFFTEVQSGLLWTPPPYGGGCPVTDGSGRFS
jgi:hypothetical protein